MKPLKETDIGKFLSGKGLDHLLQGIGDMIPGIRTLERLKDVVLGNNSKLTEDDKKQFMEIYKLNLEELDKRLTDVANARTREKEFVAAAGHIDWFMTVFGIVILVCFVYTVVISTMGTIPLDMREIFIESRAAVRDIVLAIAAYYWGSSAGSRMKEMKKDLGG
ncbi:MAG: hypothetical protein HOP08_15980 [Cyclobacteriaceae bacterium]|nr:hypothetical protein [Cyclobacteriaceae bacterium]